MALTTEQMNKIVLDVAHGIQAPANESAEEKDFRKEISKEVKTIRDSGGGVDLGHEFPLLGREEGGMVEGPD